MYEKELRQLGLTSGEARVYEALLRTGPSTVGPVVKRAGVAYSNIYEILNRLIQKGVVSFVIKEKTRYFQAVEPIRLKDYLDAQELKLNENKSLFLTLLPVLERFKSNLAQEEARIFVGASGLMTAYQLFFKGALKNERAYFIDPDYTRTKYEFFVKANRYFRKIGLRWNGIVMESCRNTYLVEDGKDIIRYRYVSFPLPASLNIFRDKLFILMWSDKPKGVLIQSKETAEHFQRYFDAVWKMAKP
ncbi:MAG: helix-turn-helix domain-containing protein [Nanoarchaeota archaeon]